MRIAARTASIPDLRPAPRPANLELKAAADTTETRHWPGKRAVLSGQRETTDARQDEAGDELDGSGAARADPDRGRRNERELLLFLFHHPAERHFLFFTFILFSDGPDCRSLLVVDCRSRRCVSICSAVVVIPTSHGLELVMFPF
ncbi:hypothetical protein TgHK011_006673 [Trichoderma gracile]|nr:hypothetical protein TgHK011_006673 [Trichoderma gracile]